VGLVPASYVGKNLQQKMGSEPVLEKEVIDGKVVTVKKTNLNVSEEISKED